LRDPASGQRIGWDYLQRGAGNTFLLSARRSLHSSMQAGATRQERRPSDQVGQIGVPGAKARRDVGRVGEEREIRELKPRTHRAPNQCVGTSRFRGLPYARRHYN